MSTRSTIQKVNNKYTRGFKFSSRSIREHQEMMEGMRLVNEQIENHVTNWANPFCQGQLSLKPQQPSQVSLNGFCELELVIGPVFDVEFRTMSKDWPWGQSEPYSHQLYEQQMAQQQMIRQQRAQQ
tara:strand:+ start:329 stop:706 length:378 start_codon:yes stop_codon:yes gene_type:complete